MGNDLAIFTVIAEELQKDAQSKGHSNLQFFSVSLLKESNPLCVKSSCNFRSKI